MGAIGWALMLSAIPGGNNRSRTLIFHLSQLPSHSNSSFLRLSPARPLTPLSSNRIHSARSHIHVTDRTRVHAQSRTVLQTRRWNKMTNCDCSRRKEPSMIGGRKKIKNSSPINIPLPTNINNRHHSCVSTHVFSPMRMSECLRLWSGCVFG